MTSTPEKQFHKIKLGKRTGGEYRFRAKIDFTKDIPSQISELLREMEINELIQQKTKEIKDLLDKYPKKEKNLEYYYEVGKRLSFIDDNKQLRNVAPYSVFRRVCEELPEILPHIASRKVAEKHLDIMYKLAHIRLDDLHKASWDQWYEIMKFRNIHKKPKLLALALKKCKSAKLSGPALRKAIEEILSTASSESRLTNR